LWSFDLLGALPVVKTPTAQKQTATDSTEEKKELQERMKKGGSPYEND
jgi:hypothetical protein